MSDVVDLFLISRLRIAKQNCFELFWFVLRVESKVDRLGQVTRGSNSLILQRRRTFRLVNVVEPRSLMFADRRSPAGWLDDEDDRVVVDTDLVFPVGVRFDDVDAVGNSNIGKAFLARIAAAVAVGIVKDNSASGCQFVSGVARR